MKNKKGQIIGLIVILFIVAVVGLSLIPSIAQTTNLATTTSGISGTASEPLINLNTLMFAILIMSGIAGLSFLIMRYVGLV